MTKPKGIVDVMGKPLFIMQLIFWCLIAFFVLTQCPRKEKEFKFEQRYGGQGQAVPKCGKCGSICVWEETLKPKAWVCKESAKKVMIDGNKDAYHDAYPLRFD
jgi:hypothetical protein